MAALATSADVEAQLGRSLTSDEEERVNALLDWASLVARRASRRQFTAGSYTVTRKVRRGRVTLPETPIDSVDEVRALYSDGITEVIDTDGYVVRGSTIYGLLVCEVEVDFTTTADVPDDIIAAVASIAARGVLDSLRDPRLKAVTIGSYSEAYFDSGASAGALPHEMSVFATYAAPSLGTIPVL